jgi:predicted nucleic acid-binding protein
VTLIDTSAWVEYLRATNSETHHQVRRFIENNSVVQTTDVIVMEVLAGGRDDSHAARLRRLLSRCEFVPTRGLDDYEQAASLYRRCRRGGETIRSVNHCLIAAIAVRSDLDLLQADRDFDALARHSELRLWPPSSSK